MHKLRPEMASLLTFSGLAMPPEPPGKGRPKAVNRARREQLASRADAIVDELVYCHGSHGDAMFELNLKGSKAEQHKVIQYAPVRRMTVEELLKVQRCRDLWFKKKLAGEQPKSDSKDEQEQAEKKESPKTAGADSQEVPVKTKKRTRGRTRKVNKEEEEESPHETEGEEEPVKVEKKAKTSTAKTRGKRKGGNSKRKGQGADDKENVPPLNPFTLQMCETGSLRKPSRSQLTGRACGVDLWGSGRTLQLFHMFDQQRERYEQNIADEQRKNEAAISKARRDAAHYQDKLSLWSVLQSE